MHPIQQNPTHKILGFAIKPGWKSIEWKQLFFFNFHILTQSYPLNLTTPPFLHIQGSYSGIKVSPERALAEEAIASTASRTESCTDSHHLLPLSLLDSHLQLPFLLIYIPYLVPYSDEDSKGSEFSSYSSYALTTTSAHLPKLIKGIPRSIQLTHFGCIYSLSTLL